MAASGIAAGRRPDRLQMHSAERQIPQRRRQGSEVDRARGARHIPQHEIFKQEVGKQRRAARGVSLAQRQGQRQRPGRIAVYIGVVLVDADASIHVDAADVHPAQVLPLAAVVAFDEDHSAKRHAVEAGATARGPLRPVPVDEDPAKGDVAHTADAVRA